MFAIQFSFNSHADCAEICERRNSSVNFRERGNSCSANSIIFFSREFFLGGSTFWNIWLFYSTWICNMKYLLHAVGKYKPKHWITLNICSLMKSTYRSINPFRIYLCIQVFSIRMKHRVLKFDHGFPIRGVSEIWLHIIFSRILALF